MVAAPDGRLFYAGSGAFTTSEAPGRGIIVMRKGETTVPLATYGGNIYALAIDGDSLIAGGDFTTLSGYAVTNLARWDGRRWNSIGGGVSGGAVRALAIHDGALYVGGGFTNAGAQLNVSGLARWDGANWTALGKVHPSVPFRPMVSALQFIGDSLFIGGCFNSVDGVPANCIAEFVNDSWRAPGSGVSLSYAAPYIVTMDVNSAGELFVAGVFDRAGDVDARNIAKWDGAKWSPLAEGIDLNSSLGIDAVRCIGADVYVAGLIYYTSTNGYRGVGVTRWDGNKWTRSDAPVYSGMAVANDADNLYVAGYLTSPLIRPYGTQTGITWFDGLSWHISGGSDPMEIWTGTIANGKPRVANSAWRGDNFAVIADWDGTNWTLIGKTQGYRIQQLLQKGDDTYIIGSFIMVNDVFANQIARYDGTNWHALGNGLMGPTCIEFAGTNLFAADANGLQRWDGVAWQKISSAPSPSIQTMVADGETLYIAFGGEIARLDGDQWTSLGCHAVGRIHTMCVANHSLYIGGFFSEAGGVPAKMLAMWDGVRWSELGGGVADDHNPNNNVRSIVPDGDGGVFVAGYFHQVGRTTDVNSITHWDGQRWLRLGSGVIDHPYTLCLSGRDLYVFGEVAVAGIYPSSAVARWHLADLELAPITASVDGGFDLEVRGRVGASYILQQSFDLQHWQNHVTNSLASARFPFHVEPPVGSSQFFKLIGAE